MIASLFYLKSLGCGACLSSLITLVIASILLLVVLHLILPQVLADLCQSQQVELLCTSP